MNGKLSKTEWFEAGIIEYPWRMQFWMEETVQMRAASRLGIYVTSASLISEYLRIFFFNVLIHTTYQWGREVLFSPFPTFYRWEG